jgi:DNA excision repair protein ERCC-2
MASDDDDDERDPPIPPHVAGGEPQEPDIVDTSSGPTDSTTGSGSAGLRTVSTDSVEEEWTTYFRYDSVYQDQIDATNTFVELLADNGYYVFEGACGTGKTLAALTGGIHAIRNQDYLSETGAVEESFPDYTRLLAVTPVKQQLRQFVEEMRGINRSLGSDETPIPSVILRGRPDMMPYADTNIPPFGSENILGEMDDLRQMARELVKFDSEVPLDWPAAVQPPDFSRFGYDWSDASETAEQYRDRYQYDPYRAEAVARIVQNMETDSDGNDIETLTVDGVETPYPELVPHTRDVVDIDTFRQFSGLQQLPADLQGRFDPFYVGFFAGEGGLSFGFRDATDHVLDRDELFELAASRGVCPHEAMAEFAGQAEVVIGNYNHLFDPQTRLLTDDKIGLIDDETIAIVDESHQIERRVRDMLSTSLDIYTLDRALTDIEVARRYASGEIEQTPTPDLSDEEVALAQQVTREALETVTGYAPTVEDLAKVENLLQFTIQKLGAYGADCLNDDFKDISWQEAVKRWSPKDKEYPLVDPEDPNDTDEFIGDAVVEGDFEAQTFRKVYPVMLALKFVYDNLREKDICDRTPQDVTVGTFFERWADEDGVEYHREVVLESQQKDSIPTNFPDWVRAWTPKLQLFNCIPRDELQAVFGELGGGVLMSATLQPDDVFTDAVGINGVPFPIDEEGEDETAPTPEDSGGVAAQAGTQSEGARPWEFEQYPLRFPAENRLSITVDLPKFKYSNRGDPTQDYHEMTPDRQQYADALEDAIATRGNILVAMPNYGEAKWAYNYLRSVDISKSFYLDQSSSAAETDETLESFFADDDAVIFTSTRGTITEGVDYDDEKLHSCIAVGIPILPTNSPRIQAIRTAYDERIGTGSGFETALTIPAVRKVRQAIGRVIRGSDEVGTRILMDSRYASAAWDGVKEFLSRQEQSEFGRTRPEQVSRAVSTFWNAVDERDDGGQSDSDTSSETTGRGTGSQAQPCETRVDTAPGEGETTKSDSADPTSEEGGDETDSNPADDATDEDTEPNPSGTYEKIYFGAGASLSGWTRIDHGIIEDEIVPLVEDNIVEDESTPHIKLNFGSDVSVSDWTQVRRSTVRREIEPIAREWKL